MEKDSIKKLNEILDDLREPQLRHLGYLNDAFLQAMEMIERVRELHKTYWNEIVFCQTCDVPYPCPTIKALDGEQ